MSRPAKARHADVPALRRVQRPVNDILGRFLREQIGRLGELHPDLVPVGEAVAGLVTAGGKRIRPAFVYWGHRATGADHDDAVLVAAGAVELLHTFALIHDDVMDRSTRRRGRPTVHVALAERHAREGLLGDAGWFGVGGAVLAGDLAFVWADELLHRTQAPADALDRARRVFTELRTEVTAGQYLDLRLAGRADATEREAVEVALLKSGRYTVTRPLQLGAALGHASPGLPATLGAYGDAVGLAFQLRDDVLGLFGDPDNTGKDVLDDLREGKRTLLVLRALQLAGPGEQEFLRQVLGADDLDEGHVEQVRKIVVACGALADVDERLAAEGRRARDAVAGLPAAAREALEQLADLVLARAG